MEKKPAATAAYNLRRYPSTDNRSLRAWSAAEEHILRFAEENGFAVEQPVLLHDRFGFLSTQLADRSPSVMLVQKSQEKAIRMNLERNKLDAESLSFITPLDPLPENVEWALMSVPKSLDLFRLYLYLLSKHLSPTATVLCGFMTKHFSPQVLKIAGEFFEEASQSRAWKKSRVLVLKQPKPFQEKTLIQTVSLNETETFQQYPGVFSASKIDMATRFLLDHLIVREGDRRVLDLGCGNGVLGRAVRQQLPETELHLLDDSWLAVESAKLNVDPENTHFHWEDTLKEFEDGFFDRVICNPPFHFEYEIDVSVPLRLFREVHRCLVRRGQFQLVANNHLNYGSHLFKFFRQVEVVERNKKFEILLCRK